MLSIIHHDLLFPSFFSQDGRAVHTMVITALPLSLSWLLTYGEVRSQVVVWSQVVVCRVYVFIPDFSLLDPLRSGKC